MKKFYSQKIVPLFMLFTLILTGCAKSPIVTDFDKKNATEIETQIGTETETKIDTSTDKEIGTDTDTATEPDVYKNDSDIFTDRDYETDYDENTSVRIQLNGDSISCDSNSVQISGTTAIIASDGTYILSGTLNDGMIVVNAGKNDKPQLILNGVSINSETSAPLYILAADKVFLTLAENTSNTLSNGGSFIAVDENNIDAAVFSKEDLTLNGMGNLTVASPAGHGIVSKDDLVFTGGTYVVNSASHGLEANDSIRITNASITIEAGKDGIHAENSDDSTLGYVYIDSGTFDISSQGDGISAESSMQIEEGTFHIVSGGGSVNASKQSSDSWGGFGGGSRDEFGGGPGGGFGDGSRDEFGSGPRDGFRNGSREQFGNGFLDEFGDEFGDRDFGNFTDFAVGTDEDSTSIKGIKASGDLLINGGTFTIDSADDAVHSNSSIFVNGGTFEISSGDDGFHADESLTVTSGTIHITESYEGLEALHLTIEGGDITLTASDDGLNAAGGTDSSGFGGPRGNDRFGGRGGSSSDGTIVITGGNLYVKAYGDGLDANGTLEIAGGMITVVGPTQGDTATLDYDVSGTITGGTFIGTGASGMAQTFSSSEQGVIAVRVNNESAGSRIVLADKSGNNIISYTPELPYAVVILSSPEIRKGETYTLTIGSTSEEFTAG